ncbi:MAG: hypothetical protein H7X95_00710 [Deltaproteobacteria bacterium]|nr:hypothetical protein [Deltaproteobacteria bacterium]
MFDDLALGEAAERLTRLRDTFATVGDQLDLAVIRFQDHRLYLKVLDSGMLCMLADRAVNLAALRMAASLVGQRIAVDLQQAPSASSVEPEASLARVPVAAPLARSPDPAVTKSHAELLVESTATPLPVLAPRSGGILSSLRRLRDRAGE